MMNAAQTLGATNEHTQRLKKRVQILQGEIAEIEGGAEEQQTQAQPAQSAPAQRQQIQEQPEEVKVAQLNEKQLKVLGIIQARSAEYMDAIQYAQNTLKNKQSLMNLLTGAENLKKLETKISEGGSLTKEDIA